MAKTQKKLAGLAPSEWAVMQVIWESGPMAAGEIYERLSGKQDWAYSTVRTLLRRMVSKGWLDAQRVGNSYLYKPAVARKRAVHRAIGEFTSRVLGGFVSPFVAYFAEKKDLSPEDIKQLEDIIRQYRKEGGK